eukprot:1360761-Pleurochrysis_carterae.AAC.1
MGQPFDRVRRDWLGAAQLLHRMARSRQRLQREAAAASGRSTTLGASHSKRMRIGDRAGGRLVLETTVRHPVKTSILLRSRALAAAAALATAAAAAAVPSPALLPSSATHPLAASAAASNFAAVTISVPDADPHAACLAAAAAVAEVA